jgi:hypothetical protein
MDRGALFVRDRVWVHTMPQIIKRYRDPPRHQSPRGEGSLRTRRGPQHFWQVRTSRAALVIHIFRVLAWTICRDLG